MYDISICFNKRDFEYDVYTLVKAFYPTSEIYTFYEGENLHPADTFLKLDVAMYDGCLKFSRDTSGVKEEACREVQEGVTRQERKNILKLLVYESLSKLTNTQLPWGTLTGIRPTKIPMKFLDEGHSVSDVAAYMEKTYRASPKKITLAIDIAAREKKLLDDLKAEDGYSLYVGIPFCPSICLYCSFGSHPFERFGHMAEDYLNALFKELGYIARKMSGKKLCTVYIGGGTPTTLAPRLLERLLGYIRQCFDTSSVREFTVEAGRPDSVDAEKLAIIQSFGVDRISINPQSMNQRTLEIIGRSHTVEQVVWAFNAARSSGFQNINMDIITGLPGEGEMEVRETIRAIEKLEPDSLTVHSLALKRATRLNLYKDKYAEESFYNSQEVMDIIDDGARRMDMLPYYMYRQKNIAGNLENIGYAKEGRFGLYNIIIMEEKQTIMAAGSGAISKFVYDDGRIERAENVKDIKQYIERIDEMLERKEKRIKCS